MLSDQLENSIDYYRRLTDCHEKQLTLAREIGSQPLEARALMFCGQVRAAYLGDHVGGLDLLQESTDLMRGSPNELYSSLRIVQIRVEQGRLAKAEELLNHIRPVDAPRKVDTGNTGTQDVHNIGRVGWNLVWMMLVNALGDELRLRKAITLGEAIQEAFVTNPQLSEQYQMVVACKLADAHRLLVGSVTDEEARDMHRRQALDLSQASLDVYESCGFVRPIEATSEEILFRHGQILLLNDLEIPGRDYIQRAYDEIVRKHALIPENTPYFRSYLENIPLHREILAAQA